MKKIHWLSRIIFFLSFFLNIVLVLQIFARISGWNLYYFFNSDSLYLSSIYKDLFEDQTGLKGWHLNASPNFIPEWPLYFLVRFISGDFRIACVLYAVLYVFIINMLSNGIFVKVFGKNNYTSLTMINLGYTIVLLSYFTNDNFLYSSFLFLGGFHVGVFIMSLLSYFLFFSYIKSKNWIYLLLLFISVMSGTLSDRLLIMFFVVPVLTSLLFAGNKNHRKEIIALNISNVLASFSGMLVYYLLKTSNYIYIIDLGYKATNFSNIIPALKSYIETVNMMLFSGSSVTLLVALSIISLLLGLYLSIVYVFSKRKLLATNTIEKIVVVLFTSFVIIVALTPVINGTFSGLSHLRFNIYAFFVALSMLVVLLHLLFRKKTTFSAISNIIVALLIVVAFVFAAARETKESSCIGLKNVFTYYPEKVSIVDSLAKKHNLKYGLGKYWDAKHITMFSKEDVRIYTVFNNLTPWFHVTNQNWYFQNGKGKFGNPEFNFILLNNFTPHENYTEIFGNSADTIQKGNVRIAIVPEFRFDKSNKPYILLDK